MRRILQQLWEQAGRDLVWGLILYLMALATLFFIFAQGQANFIYTAF
jgi:hypothetical protein